MGEFRKRIRELFRMDKMIWDKEKECWIAKETESFDVTFAEFMRVIEDAKQEFPEVFLPYGHKQKWCNPEKAAKWFEKWLGETDG